jgi:hypothetical protein
MALVVGCSFLLRDRLLFNDAFPLFFLLIPVAAAVYSSLGRRRATGRPNIWDRWVAKWLGSSVLGLTASFAIWFVSGFIPYDGGLAYNYPRFHYVYSRRDAALQQVSAGDQARDATVYTLEGNPLGLSELWKEKPIVVEFGSIT